jgi:hypothetical protein
VCLAAPLESVPLSLFSTPITTIPA